MLKKNVVVAKSLSHSIYFITPFNNIILLKLLKTLTQRKIQLLTKNILFTVMADKAMANGKNK
jgi:hypothetical protein